MTDPTPAPVRSLGNAFSLGLDGNVAGDPTHGLLAAQLRYVARLAAGLGETLALGRLTSVSTTGTSAVSAQISWDLGGECVLRGHVFPPLTGPLHPPAFPLVAPGTSGDEAALACLALAHEVPGLEWGVLVRRDRSVLASVGDPQLAQMPEVGVRGLGVLAGLDERYRETCVWLGFEHRTVVVSPMPKGCVVLCLTSVDTVALIGDLLRVRATLAPIDMDRVTPLAAPYRPAEQVLDEAEELDDDWAWEPDPTPLTGARFAGSVGADRPRKPREGRWFRRSQAS
ncbi:hypothetical protein [Nocardioides daphniae]|uniref:Uncharacterized protein n=1 Tax=Nocardioides daphniae TaxID=402297 RepID=A0A4P7UIE9_9ACTN|nr:hypothetical protein [Nocardioides daphniae]QCC78319.1 hypothetical protein E2C04_15990 [Nocardioides daphniae]GGD13604.1 hypothetical protein GCM10007231_10810 [Nocardioides daphniae]